MYNVHFSLLIVVDRLPRKDHNYFVKTDSGLVSLRIKISPQYSLLEAMYMTVLNTKTLYKIHPCSNISKEQQPKIYSRSMIILTSLDE